MSAVFRFVYCNPGVHGGTTRFHPIVYPQMALTDVQIRNAAPLEKAYKLADSGGLFLLVHPNGGKYFRLKYRVLGKEKLLALGVYPEITLKDAREARDKAKEDIRSGIDPSAARKIEKITKGISAGNSFEAIGREWIERRKDEISESHCERITRALEKDLFPRLGQRPILDISSLEILDTLRRIEERGAYESSHRAKTIVSLIFRYAIATGRASRDPCPDLKGALKTPKKNNFSAITDPSECAELLKAIEGYRGTFEVRQALRLAPMVFCRPGEIRHARWCDIDLDKGTWVYLASKRRITHAKVEHLVPLSTQAIEILRETYSVTGSGEFVFPGLTSSRPLSENTLNQALRRLGFDKERMTSHGFRAMARTLLAEELHQRAEAIEHQLSHTVPDNLGTAYNRTKFLSERRSMMQLWADYLDQLRAGNSPDNLVRMRPTR